ncbi:MAG: hypothetical protein C4583_13255 [Anaerolineaceae bacterium]|nr:MAG: hypothetical protein C4583_13255 [Anaerolineaceae bacterium]
MILFSFPAGQKPTANTSDSTSRRAARTSQINIYTRSLIIFRKIRINYARRGIQSDAPQPGGWLAAKGIGLLVRLKDDRSAIFCYRGAESGIRTLVGIIGNVIDQYTGSERHIYGWVGAFQGRIQRTRKAKRMEVVWIDNLDFLLSFDFPAIQIVQLGGYFIFRILCERKVVCTLFGNGGRIGKLQRREFLVIGHIFHSDRQSTFWVTIPFCVASLKLNFIFDSSLPAIWAVSRANPRFLSPNNEGRWATRIDRRRRTSIHYRRNDKQGNQSET